MSDTPATILRKARIAKGFKTAVDAAAAFGWNKITYTSHENGTRGISIGAAKRYARAFTIDLSSFLGVNILKTEQVGGDVWVMGDVSYGVWRESSIVERGAPSRRLAGIPAKASDGSRMAVHVTDESCDISINPGEYAIFVLDQIVLIPAYDGHLAVVERERGGLVERTIRKATLTKEGTLRLTAHSRNAKFAQSITYPSTSATDRVTILGRVVGKYADL